MNLHYEQPKAKKPEDIFNKDGTLRDPFAQIKAATEGIKPQRNRGRIAGVFLGGLAVVGGIGAGVKLLNSDASTTRDERAPVVNEVVSGPGAGGEAESDDNPGNLSYDDINQPGAGGNPDSDDNPDNNVLRYDDQGNILPDPLPAPESVTGVTLGPVIID